jgi:hypothetical protein
LRGLTWRKRETDWRQTLSTIETFKSAAIQQAETFDDANATRAFLDVRHTDSSDEKK